MKAILILLALSATAAAQDYGLGVVQPPVVVQQYTQPTFGLGIPVRRSIAQRVVYEIPSPVVTQPVQVVSQPVYVQPMQVYQPRWQMVRQRQCTPSGCREVWVRVWR